MVQKRSHTCKKEEERDLPKKKDNGQKENMAVTTEQEK
jgi:hypothetical protein